MLQVSLIWKHLLSAEAAPSVFPAQQDPGDDNGGQDQEAEHSEEGDPAHSLCDPDRVGRDNLDWLPHRKLGGLQGTVGGT